MKCIISMANVTVQKAENNTVEMVLYVMWIKKFSKESKLSKT